MKINAIYSDETQAEFLNFTIYFIFGESSNLKIWRLPKNARTFVLAITRAIFYIRCCQQFLFNSPVNIISYSQSLIRPSVPFYSRLLLLNVNEYSSRDV